MASTRKLTDETVFDTGDTAWMLTATGLVLMMTIPGLSLYYAGMIPKKRSVMTTAMQSFSITCLVSILWMIFGYSLSLTSGSIVLGDASRFWLLNLNIHGAHANAPTIPEPVYCAFQLTFAVITAALSCGASADRMKFGSMLLFIAIWHIVVYCPVAHWFWSPNGFLNRAGVLDYAGGCVVHVDAGMTGLATSIVLGKRFGFGKKKFIPHNILYTIMGASMLWVGWYGFNAGSAGGANSQAAMAMLATQIATSVAAFSWILMELVTREKPTVLGMLNGAIAGLVAITPAAGYVNSTGAFFIGLLSGPVSYYGIKFKKSFGLDDSLDAFGLHGIAGLYGSFMTGLFAVNFVDDDHRGAFYGNGRQLGIQIYGMVVAVGWTFTMSFIIAKAIEMTLGMRISLKTETSGLDRSIHGEGLYVEKSAVKSPTQKVAELLRSYAIATNTPVPDFLSRMEEGMDDDVFSEHSLTWSAHDQGESGVIKNAQTRALSNSISNSQNSLTGAAATAPYSPSGLRTFTFPPAAPATPLSLTAANLSAVGLSPSSVDLEDLLPPPSPRSPLRVGGLHSKTVSFEGPNKAATAAAGATVAAAAGEAVGQQSGGENTGVGLVKRSVAFAQDQVEERGKYSPGLRDSIDDDDDDEGNDYDDSD